MKSLGLTPKQKEFRSIRQLSTLAFCCVAMSACTTVKMPKLDFVKFPEFLEEAGNIKNYPKVSDAPAAPTDVRSAAAWDSAAREIAAIRDQSRTSLKTPVETEHQLLTPEEFEALKAQVKAYKLDDPQ